ncbi:nucleotide exchange factor GrpE [Caldichromatium japonicum]|uniref:Protein GrpE n=1 Tax=Caldichromatium japonicum TaxID=2699430 RepID=A0A6G7VFN8_9GAMM|nr:nucleotide exchange factor GrpE [Caldichromatium japonicum]QIK38893.1 nucleotide exchange factor GrpE [Caldichromatium japonicum]
MNMESRQTEPGAQISEAARREAVDAYREALAVDETPAAMPETSETRPEETVSGIGDAASAAGEPSVAELSAALDAARSEIEESRNQVLRARAELENIKRRHAQELEKAHKFALDAFVRELLRVRDSLELGYAAALEATASIDQLREGTALTLKLLSDVMERFGVGVIDPLNQPFDPEFHQAMSMQPREDLPANTVALVVQKGYTLNGRLVRPALVVVSQAPGAESA